MGKSTISMVIFNSYVSHYQRVEKHTTSVTYGMHFEPTEATVWKCWVKLYFDGVQWTRTHPASLIKHLFSCYCQYLTFLSGTGPSVAVRVRILQASRRPNLQSVGWCWLPQCTAHFRGWHKGPKDTHDFPATPPYLSWDRMQKKTMQSQLWNKTVQKVRCSFMIQ